MNDIEMMTKELPMNFGPLKGANANAKIKGPCGDAMEFWLQINNNKIIASSFTTDGCETSIICGSTTGYMVQNKLIDDAYLVSQKDVLSEIGYMSDEFEHCALLAVNTIKKAIEEYKLNHQPNCQKESECDNNCCSCQSECEKRTDQDVKVDNRIPGIKHKIAVLSGKGGVGKSTVAVNLALTLASLGHKVGLMDVDIHGPSIPTLLNLHNINVQADHNGIIPIELENLKVISIGFFLKNPADPLIWRGPMKMNVINQFLHEVIWGEIDYLIIDLPPGTGDEPLSIGQAFSNQDGAVIVTTPQKVATADVSKSINFCRKLGLSMLGLIENMSGFVCPKCGETTNIFSSGGGKALAMEFNIPFLGNIPIDPAIVCASDEGMSSLETFNASKTSKIFKQVVASILQQIETKKY